MTPRQLPPTGGVPTGPDNLPVLVLIAAVLCGIASAAAFRFAQLQR